MGGRGKGGMEGGGVVALIRWMGRMEHMYMLVASDLEK